MSNIYPAISEKLAELNIDIYHYEDIVRCYILARLNIQHSKQPDFEDGIHSAEFATEVSCYQLQPADAYYHNPAFCALCRELVAAGIDRNHRLFLDSFAPFLVADWESFEGFLSKEHHDKLLYVLYLILKSTNDSQLSFAQIDTPTIESFYDTNSTIYDSLALSKTNLLNGIYQHSNWIYKKKPAQSKRLLLCNNATV